MSGRSGPSTFEVRADGDLDIVVVRSFAATRDLVWRAFTTPALLARWLGPRTWSMDECEVDLRSGGRSRYVMRGPDGESMTMVTDYDEVDEPCRIVGVERFSDAWNGPSTHVITTFEELDGVTTVTITVRHETPEARDMALRSGMDVGMAEGYARLDDLVAGDEPSSGGVRSDLAQRYALRADRFEALVADTPADRWAWPSPCDEWTARDVVRHIIDMHAAMLHPLGEAPTAAPLVDDDPLAAYRSARRDIESRLADGGVAEREVETPTGLTTFEAHVDQVVSADLVLHGWDLARATGQDDTIDPEEVAAMLPFAETMPEELRIPGAFGPGIVVFGPEFPVRPGASDQERLIALLGRDPHFEPVSSQSA